MAQFMKQACIRRLIDPDRPHCVKDKPSKANPCSDGFNPKPFVQNSCIHDSFPPGGNEVINQAKKVLGRFPAK